MKLYGKATEIGAEIVERFKNPAGLPAPLANVFIRRKDNVPCRSWSWSNQLIVAIRGFTEARGYRQWEQVGRHVKKGEKAVWILAPCVRKVATEGEDGAVEEHSAVFGFRSIPVFGLEQTDGQPLLVDSEVIRWIESLPLRDVAESWGIHVETFNGREGEALGYFSPAGSIALGVENLSTWCHELCHAADSRNVGGLKPGQHVDQEIVAELGSAVLLTILGKPVDADLGGCWRYVQSYAAKVKRETAEVCIELLNRTCKAVDLILTAAETLQAASVTA